MIRFILGATFLAIYLVFGHIVLGLLWLYSKINKPKADLLTLRFVQWGFGVILSCSGVKTTVIGEENIPDEPVLYIGNHRSYFDIPLLYTRCKRLTGFVSKKEMLKFPLLPKYMRRVYCLFLDRENPREGLKTILQAIEYVKQGVSITIFPEGTRNDGEELSMLPFHEGSFKIATKTGCAIIPVSINNSVDLFENHVPRLKPAHVIIEYGKPIYPKDLDKETAKHIGAHVQNIIQETINKNHSLV